MNRRTSCVVTNMRLKSIVGHWVIDFASVLTSKGIVCSKMKIVYSALCCSEHT